MLSIQATSLDESRAIFAPMASPASSALRASPASSAWRASASLEDVLRVREDTANWSLAEFDALTGRCCDRSGRFHIDDESDIVVETLTLWTLYPKGSQSYARSPSKSFDLVFHRLDRLIGLADQDAQGAGGIELDPTHRQPCRHSPLQQAGG